MDQAQSLREYMQRLQMKEEVTDARVITITSGKGGVGKSNFTLNFAYALKAEGKKVVILDLDLSTANLNILMGKTPRYSLFDCLRQQKSIWDVLETGTDGIEYIPGGFEVQDLLFKMDAETLLFFWEQIEELQSYADFILLDTGAGISEELVEFILASDETFMITTPEPTAIADAYSVIKTVKGMSEQSPSFRLIVNRAQTFREAVDTSRAIKNACSQFLKVNVKTLGFIMEDPHVRKSVKQQKPLYLAYPNCQAAKDIKQMVHTYLPDMKGDSSQAPARGIRGFFEKILTFGKSK